MRRIISLGGKCGPQNFRFKCKLEGTLTSDFLINVYQNYLRKKNHKINAEVAKLHSLCFLCCVLCDKEWFLRFPKVKKEF